MIIWEDAKEDQDRDREHRRTEWMNHRREAHTVRGTLCQLNTSLKTEWMPALETRNSTFFFGDTMKE